ISQCLQQFRCDRRAERAALSPKRRGLDLLGRSHEYRQPRKSTKPAGEASRLSRPPGTLPNSRDQARTPEAARFDELPRNQPWNSESEFSHSRNQRQSESRISGDAQKVAHEKITTFLHAQTSRNRKGSRANRQHHALQDQRINECRVKIERVKGDPNFAGATYQ